jgi:hypothetical protein
VPKTPYGMWIGQKLNLNHLKIWGYPSYALTKRNKLELRSELYYFVGYPKELEADISITLRSKRCLLAFMLDIRG